MITAVIAKWKRPNELEKIITHLGKFPRITEIIIRDNTVDNLMSYGKYVEARKAKNDIIYFQDDDCIVYNVNDLIDIFLKHGGTCMINALKATRISEYQGADTMMGWGSVFKKEWIKVLDIYLETYGVDYLLKRESDRIFSGLLNYHTTIRANLDDFPSAHDPEIALWRQSDHDEMKRRAREVIAILKADKIPCTKTNQTFDYWEKRYCSGGNSGTGSQSYLGEYKAQVVNDFIKKHEIQSMIDYGSGDGRQAMLLHCPRYLGFDASPEAVRQCKERNPGKIFKHIFEYQGDRADLTISMDVLYHLLEDHLFEVYMQRLFASSNKYVIIYAYNREAKSADSPHLKCRKFTDWIEKNISEFKLLEYLKNPHYSTIGSMETESEFYIYENPNGVIEKPQRGVSVILSAWGTQKYIRATLDSIEYQTAFMDKDNFEVLVGIDNCELVKAEMEKIMRNYRNLHVFWFTKNVGTYIVKNTLAYKAKYERLHFIDSDDIFYPNAIEEHLRNAEKGEVICQKVKEFKVNPRLPILNPNHIGGAWSINKELFYAMGGFMPWFCEADTEFTQRAHLKGYRYYIIDVPLLHRRIHERCLTIRKDTGMTSQLRKELHAIREERLKNKVVEPVKPVFGDCIELEASRNNTTS